MHSELSSFYHLLTLKEEIPHFRNLRFKNITGNALEAGYIIGLKESVIRNLTLTDIDLDTKESIKQLKKFIDNIKDHNERKDIINKLEFYLN